MARLKSKQFKKTYASAVNQPQDGVWSGRGIAVPAAGGMLGGDDYKQKIGRGKKPYHRGNAGTPSQGADSTFSSYLARVNSGYEDHEQGPMFPEQEPDLEDTYSGETSIRSRKVPKDFKILRPKTKGLKEKMEFNDNHMIQKSRYSLKSLLETDSDVARPDLDASRTKQLVIDFLGDALLWAGDKFGFDISGTVLVVPAVAFNVVQLWLSNREGRKLLEQFESNPTDELVREMDGVIRDIIRDVVDIIQRLIEAIPFTSPIGEEDLSFLLGQLSTTQAGQSIARSGGDMYSDLRSKLHPALVAILEYVPVVGPGQGMIASALMKAIISQSLDMMGKLHKARTDYINRGKQLVGPAGTFDPQKGNNMGFNKNIMPSEEQAVVDFINESIYPDYGSYHPPSPEGYQYRNVPVVVSKDSEKSEFDVLEDYDNEAVSYKVDGGVMTYQDRNKLVKEYALRRIIRRDIASIFEASTKKKRY
jgi:hypothetical protein